MPKDRYVIDSNSDNLSPQDQKTLDEARMTMRKSGIDIPEHFVVLAEDGKVLGVASDAKRDLSTLDSCDIARFSVLDPDKNELLVIDERKRRSIEFENGQLVSATQYPPKGVLKNGVDVTEEVRKEVDQPPHDPETKDKPKVETKDDKPQPKVQVIDDAQERVELQRYEQHLKENGSGLNGNVDQIVDKEREKLNSGTQKEREEELRHLTNMNDYHDGKNTQVYVIHKEGMEGSTITVTNGEIVDIAGAGGDDLARLQTMSRKHPENFQSMLEVNLKDGTLTPLDPTKTGIIEDSKNQKPPHDPETKGDKPKVETKDDKPQPKVQVIDDAQECVELQRYEQHLKENGSGLNGNVDQIVDKEREKLNSGTQKEREEELRHLTNMNDYHDGKNTQVYVIHKEGMEGSTITVTNGEIVDIAGAGGDDLARLQTMSRKHPENFQSMLEVNLKDGTLTPLDPTKTGIIENSKNQKPRMILRPRATSRRTILTKDGPI